jgi:hypothetical protein
MSERLCRPNDCRDQPAEGRMFEEIVGQYGTTLIDTPWRFTNRTGKVGPEQWRLHRYATPSISSPMLSR